MSGLFINLFPYLLGLLAALSRLFDVVGLSFDSLRTRRRTVEMSVGMERPRKTGQSRHPTHLLPKTHVELMLDAVAAACDLVPHPFGVAFVESLNEMRAVCGKGKWQLAVSDVT